MMMVVMRNLMRVAAGAALVTLRQMAWSLQRL
jgi:hypothetical protein